jgi:enamine deaminase RidA (YjgF/YER057c/UK114 family)
MPTSASPGDAASRLAELGIELPAPPSALGAYTPFVLAGDLLLTSGVLPLVDGQLRCAGRVGAEVAVEEAAAAARLCALNLLAVVQAATGSLDAVRQMLRLDGYVRSAKEFTAQATVLNGASELLVAVLGERGRHTRTAVGTAELPLGAAVEVSAMVRVFPDLVAPAAPGR